MQNSLSFQVTVPLMRQLHHAIVSLSDRLSGNESKNKVAHLADFRVMVSLKAAPIFQIRDAHRAMPKLLARTTGRMHYDIKL